MRNSCPCGPCADSEAQAAEGGAAVALDEDLNEEDDDAEIEDALLEGTQDAQRTASQAAVQRTDAAWEGNSFKNTAGKTYYKYD